MTKDEYASYLQSEHWQKLRAEMFDSDSFCNHCEVPRWLAEIAYDQDLHLHHLNYASLGREQWEDLEILCRRCHEIETFGRSELRELKQAHCELCERIHFNYRSRLCQTCRPLFEGPYLYNIQKKDLPRPDFDGGSVFDYLDWFIQNVRRGMPDVQ